jgi:hypothetical protein
MEEEDHESIARQAYRFWEEQGRPEGQHLDHWLEAEAEVHRQSWSLAVPDGGPGLNNLDRALPPAERRRARDRRQGSTRSREPLVIPDHFMAVVDRAHLRIYRVDDLDGPPQFELAESHDLPAGQRHYTDRDTDQAGRFAGGGGRGRQGGGASIDERLPMRNEHERRLATELAGHLGRFLQEHGDATWDYAAGPAVHNAVLDRLPPAVRARLGLAIVKELVHQTPAQLRAHFIPAETANQPSS